jgi:hypothetical protein
VLAGKPPDSVTVTVTVTPPSPAANTNAPGHLAGSVMVVDAWPLELVVAVVGEIVAVHPAGPLCCEKVTA